MESLIAIPIEFSQTWAQILASREARNPALLPGFIDVFFIAWQDQRTNKYVGWSCNLSTSEPSPHPGCDAFVVAHVRVDLRERSEAGIAKASEDAVDRLIDVVLRDPDEKYLTFRNKFAADTTAPDKPDISKIIDVVDEHDFRALLRGTLGSA